MSSALLGVSDKEVKGSTTGTRRKPATYRRIKVDRLDARTREGRGVGRCEGLSGLRGGDAHLGVHRVQVALQLAFCFRRHAGELYSVAHSRVAGADDGRDIDMVRVH